MKLVRMNPVISSRTPKSPPRPIDTQKTFNSLLDSFKEDDWILIAIILVLFFEGTDDYIMLAVLGYLFVMGLVQKDDAK